MLKVVRLLALSMLIATFRLEPDAVALAETLEELSGIKVKAEQIAAHSTQWTMPCLWVVADDFEAVDDALKDDPSVDSIVEDTAFVDEKHYQLDWSDEVDERIDRYIDHEGTIMNARATADYWEVRFRFTQRTQFDVFRNELHERGHSFELLSLVQPEESRHSLVQLTPAQREATHAAKEHGYYEVPRRITTRELADELDMSHQNLSRLLRRATKKLIDRGLESPPDSDDS